MAESSRQPDLSPRELEIARAYAGGASYRDIAEQLFIAPNTVRTHLGTIYRKLQVSSKVELLMSLQQVGPDKAAVPANAAGASDAKANLPPRPVIVVLPFVNMSQDADQEFFADGLTEDIITRLSYLRGVRVFSRTSSFIFKGQNKQIQEICAELGARYALEGSVRASGAQLRVVSQLIDGETGTHIWAQKYDRAVEDIFDLQDDITHQIVVALQVILSDGETALDPGGTQDYAAWEVFQQGTVAHLKYTAEGNLQARRLYLSALECDPNFIDAKVYLAWTYWQHARSGFAHERDAEFSRCRELLNELLAAEKSTANIKHLEAATLLFERDYEAAIAASEMAVSLGPSKLFGHTPSALVNVYTGQFERAVAILRETIRAIPYTPTDTIYNLAGLMSLMGEHDRAVPLAEEYMRRVPNDLYAYITLAIAYSLAGMPERAAEAIASFRELFPNFCIADFVAHEPYRDASKLDELVAVLLTAGLPQ